ncbi:hypothetical protein Tco_1367969 [Tanacetum coccineum]
MEYERRVNERQIQTTEEKTDTSNALDALDASSVIIESNGTESKEQDTSSRSGNDAHVEIAESDPLYDEAPMLSPTEEGLKVVATKKDISEKQGLARNFDLMITNDVKQTFQAFGLQQQMASAGNNTSGPASRSQGQNASDYDNTDPVLPKTKFVLQQKRTDSSQQVRISLSVLYYEEYYNPTHDAAKENINDQAPNASLSRIENLSIAFCKRSTNHWKDDYKAKVVWKNKKDEDHRTVIRNKAHLLQKVMLRRGNDFEESLLQLLAWEAVRNYLLPHAHTRSSPKKSTTQEAFVLIKASTKSLCKPVMLCARIQATIEDQLKATSRRAFSDADTWPDAFILRKSTSGWDTVPLVIRLESWDVK